MTKQQIKLKQMTEQPVQSLIVKLAIPSIISMLITSIYNMADSFFVSKISTSATGAVGVVFSFMFLIQAIGFLFGQGSGNYISRALGDERIKDAEVMSASGFAIAFLAGCVLLIVSLFFGDVIVDILGTTSTIKPYAVTYLRIIALATPFMCSSLVLNNQLRYQGNAAYAMVGIATGGIINIILDPILIFKFDLGIAGAAYATAFSQTLSFVLLFIGTFLGSNLRIRLSRISFNPKTYIEICINGFPSLARQGLGSLAAMALNHTAAAYGDPAVAAMTVFSRLNFFANAAVIGFGQGFQPVCGFNYGAKLYSRVRKAYWFCVKTCVIFLVVIGAILFINAEAAIRIFEKDNELVWHIGSAALRFESFALPLGGFTILSNMLLQTIRKPVSATLLSMCRQGLIFIPAIVILNYLFEITGMELAQPVADVISFIIGIFIIIPVDKELKNKADEFNISTAN